MFLQLIKGDAAIMECYYAHLPLGVVEMVTSKEPTLQLISSKKCPNFQRPCKKKTENICCLGMDKHCIEECPNNK